MIVLPINGKKFDVDDSFNNLSPEERDRYVAEIEEKMGGIVLPINGKKFDVDDSFNNLSPEERDRYVAEIEEKMGGIGDNPHRGVFQEKTSNNGLIGQFTDGFLGQTADLVDFLNPLEDLTGSLRTGIEDLGLPVAEYQPENLLETAAFGAGSAGGFLVPGAGALKIIGKSAPYFGRLGDRLKLGAGAGAGGEYFERLGGELVGGVAAIVLNQLRPPKESSSYGYYGHYQYGAEK